MPLSEEIVSNRYSISAYTADSVSINEEEYRHSLILSATKIINPWLIKSIDALNVNSFEQILSLHPEVVLLGTGKCQIFPHPEVYGFFGEKGIGLEVMDNGALCRTFNILVAEDRAVVAAIFQPTSD